MPIVVEILAPDGRVVASVSLPARETFWSDGAFTPGPGFGAYADFFRDLEAASRRFDEAIGAEEVEALATLAELWIELNHLRIRERGVPGWLDDVGLLLTAAARGCAVTGAWRRTRCPTRNSTSWKRSPPRTTGSS